MRIFVTGDCHSDFSRFNRKNFSVQEELTKEDIVIICGDFGGVFMREETEEERENLDLLNEMPFTTVFADGNHENFNRLYSFPEVEFYGGRAHKIRDSIFHLMRGEIFNFGGQSFFVFGGAKSADIRDGVMDPERICKGITDPKVMENRIKMIEHTLHIKGYQVRTNGYTYWPQELPSKEEMKRGVDNLEKAGWRVDYVITHDAPTPVVAMLGYKTNRFNDYLEGIRKKTRYGKWFCGHHHIDQKIITFDLLYRNIIELNVFG